MFILIKVIIIRQQSLLRNLLIVGSKTHLPFRQTWFYPRQWFIIQTFCSIVFEYWFNYGFICLKLKHVINEIRLRDLFWYILYFEHSGAVNDWNKRLVALEDTVFSAHEPTFFFHCRILNEINESCLRDCKMKRICKAFIGLLFLLINSYDIDDAHACLIKLDARIYVIISLNVLFMNLFLNQFVYDIRFSFLQSLLPLLLGFDQIVSVVRKFPVWVPVTMRIRV